MPSVNEALGNPTQIAAALAQGEQTISLNDSVVFTQYRRAVLPLDGLVFWIATNATRTVQCSIHTETVTRQGEAETSGTTNVVLTTTEELDDLLAVDPQTKWIGAYQGLQFAFTREKRFYQPAALFHYFGVALQQNESTQVINDPTTTLDPAKLIATNSLPVFLALNTYVPPYDSPYIPANLPELWPSYLVPANLSPPFAAVHVENSDNLQPVAWRNNVSDPYGLSSDQVRITTYGLDNRQALLLRDAIVQFCEDQGIIGLQEISPIRDERLTQVDFGIVAQKKTLSLRVSYLQSAVIAFARQQFQKVITDYVPKGIYHWPPAP